MNQNRGIWIAIIVIIILALLGWWWLASGPSSSMMTSTTATSTVATSTGTTSGSVTTTYPVTNSGTDVVSIAEGLPSATKFASLLESTGIGATIRPTTSNGNKYTIFVPTDGAFSQLPSGTIANMTGAQLKRLVQYHIVAGRAIDASAQNTGVIQALSGDPLNFSDTSTNIPQVNSSIIVAEYQGSNGVVYLINGVLLPPMKPTP